MYSSSLFSQPVHAPYQRDFVPKTPEAATFNKYGHIGVSHFTGSPNISFPLSLSEDASISINYNASGIKPEEPFGWVGTNWNLNTGGMISRIKRGLIDEFKVPANEENILGVDINYFNNNFRLQGSQSHWDTFPLVKKLTPIIIFSNNDSVTNRTNIADLEPDEFVFNFNGYSGSFMLNHEGKWVFRGNNPSEMEVIDMQIANNIDILLNPINNADTKIPRAIIRFVLRTNDGTEYHFGNTNLSAVDFTWSFRNSTSSYPYIKGELVTSTGWHLTKIKYVSGKEINYVYNTYTDSRQKWQDFILRGNKTRNLGNITATQPNNSSNIVRSSAEIFDTYTVIWNAQIKEIQTPNEIIKLSKENLVGHLDYNISFSVLGLDLNLRKKEKLTKVQTFKKPIEVNAKPLIEYQFEYDKSASNRLQLKSIKQIDVESTSIPPASINQYGFEYNTGTLPNYMSGSVDHWGYFNGRGMFDPFVTPSLTSEAAYKDVREPNINVMGHEMLRKIIYPTGGYTEFEFEPHSYSSFVKSELPKNAQGLPLANTAFDITTLTSNKIAGGVRIKKMIDSDGVKNVEKSYLYVKNYKNQNSPTFSSGVLASEPTYFDIFKNGFVGTIYITDFIFMNEQSLNPINEVSGSPVTYSEVVEKLADNSYTVYSFSNNDNAIYRNRTAKASIKRFPSDYFATSTSKDVINQKLLPTIDFEHLRGRLLSQKEYDATDNIVKEVANQYTSTLDETQAIRAVTYRLAGIPIEQPEEHPLFKIKLNLSDQVQTTSYYIHTSPVFLTKTTTTDYFNNPTAQVSVVTVNEYDNRKNITKQTITHFNNTEPKSNSITEYKYAYNGTISPIKQIMQNKFMIGIPLETTNNFNKGNKVEYNTFSNGTIPDAVLPHIFYSQNKTGAFTEQFRINGYTQFDKPTQTQAKGTNSSNSTTITNYVWQNGLLLSKTFGELKWVFTYDMSKRQLIERTDENGLKMRFEYDGYRRLKKIDDRYVSGNIEATKQATTEYNYVYNPPSAGYSYVETKKWLRNVTNATPNTDKIVTKQYVDGLGRPLSMVKEYYTPAQQHQKNYVEYDNIGRQSKVYQPIQRSSLGIESNIPATLSGVAYVQTIYESSPQSRPVKQILEDGRFVQTQYTTNIANEVRAFTVILNRVSDEQLLTVNLNSYYPANTLFKTIVWDENGTTNQSNLASRYEGRTEVFKDKLDRVILTRKFVKNLSGSFVSADTYNVYDDFSNLVMVIPPDAINASGVVYSLVFQYNYDNLYRLIEKKVPGAKYVRFYYNDRDLMVLMQDGNMRNSSYGGTSNTGSGNAFNRKYLATLYDKIGRSIKTGFTGASFPSLSLGQDFEVTDAHIATRLTTTEFYRRDDNGTINPNGALSTNWVKHQESKILKNTSVSTVREHAWSYIERRIGHEYTGNPIWSGKQHLLCRTKRYGWMDVGDAPIDDNDTDGVDWRVSAYNGAQMPTTTLHYTFSTNYAQQVRTGEFFNFDHALRLSRLDHSFSMGGAGLPTPFTLSQLNYNFKDQLIEKNIGYNASYAKYLQSIDYAYNVRGWLTHINQLSIANTTQSQLPIPTPQTPSSGTIQNLAILPFVNKVMQGIAVPYKQANAEEIAAVNDDNIDLYNQTILYDNPDSRFGSPTPQYNGNISNTYWNVAGRNIQGYGYKYDELNRLTEANYYDVENGITSSPGFIAGKFTEKVTEYDLRGNIKKLQRSGFKEPIITANNDVVANYGEIDNLTYIYDPSNLNRIQRITDGTTAAHLTKGFKYNNATTASYLYDDNGNMIYDPNKGLTITYNYLNLPETITMPSGDGHVGVIQFVYDASGYKHRRIVTKRVSGTSGIITTDLKMTDYVGGHEYEVTNPNPTNGTILSPTNSLPSRLHHTEGAITKEANGNTYQYEYVLRDHLGNTRVTFKDKDNNAVIDFSNSNPSNNEISQINHFYPYGLNMEGNWTGQSGANKYQYNGKELNDDFGLGWYDYGARFYDAAGSRWWSVDKLSEETVQIDKSPYAYAWNNPVNLDDPDGNCPRCLKALVKTAVKSIAKGKLDAGEVYDAVDAVKTMFDPTSTAIDKGFALFDLFSPVSSKEIKAAKDFITKADDAGDAAKAAKKVNKNANDAEGNFVLYEVKDKDGNVVKVGKADADRTNAAGQPVRMKDSERKARKDYPGATATQIPGSNQSTTGAAKEAEAQKVREHRANGNALPLNKEKDKRYHNN